MAMIQLNVSGKADVRWHDCLAIDLSKDLDGGVPYARDAVFLHGSAEDIRRLAGMMLDAVQGESRGQKPAGVPAVVHACREGDCYC